jgi:hypothetical protein
MVRLRSGRVVHPGGSVLDLVQGVDGDHDHHRGRAPGPGRVAGTGRVPPFCHEDPQPGAAVGHVVGGELGDVLVVSAAALGLDDGEESIADVMDDDIGEPAAEMELVRDVVGRPGLRHARSVGGGLGGEGAEDLIERREDLFWELSAPDGLEQSERTDGRCEVARPSSLGAIAVSDGGGEHARTLSNKRSPEVGRSWVHVVVGRGTGGWHHLCHHSVTPEVVP